MAATAKNQYMEDALRSVIASATSIDDLKRKAHAAMVEQGIFGATDGKDFSTFDRKNPYFSTLAAQMFSPTQRKQANAASTNTKANSKSKTMIVIIVAMAIIVIAGAAWYFLKK